MKRILILFLALTLLLLPACAEEPDLPVQQKAEFQRTDVINYKTTAWGDYLYFTRAGLTRCNWKTGEVSSCCTDPTCKKNCLLHDMLTVEMGPVVDNKLYFSGHALRTTKGIMYASLDLVTDEVKLLLSLPSVERYSLNPPVLEGEWLYYIARYLPDGADATDPDAYLPYVGRLPKDGGKTEFVCDIAPESGERLRAVVDGKVITELAGCLYITDPATKERKVFFDPEEHGLFRYITCMHLLNGSFYFLCDTGEQMEYRYEEYSEKAAILHLFKMNVKTGKLEQISDVPMDSFNLTDDTIYYYEKEIRIFYMPEDYKENPDDIRRTHTGATIYACDLDGSNVRAVFTDPYLHLSLYPNTIVNGRRWGCGTLYDEETRDRSQTPWGIHDFNTGEFIPATFVD